MDENLQVLLILAGVAAVAGFVAALVQSQRIRRHGLFGALRRNRMFSGGSGRVPHGR